MAVLGDLATLKPRLQLEAVRQGIETAPHVVWLSDGARGFWRLFDTCFAHVATGILDFYHASEYLHEFSKVLFSKKTQNDERLKWIDTQILRLLNNKIITVIEEIEEMTLTGKTKIKAQQKNIT